MVRVRTVESRLRDMRETLEALMKPERLAELLLARLVALSADPVLIEEARHLLRHIQEALALASAVK